MNKPLKPQVRQAGAAGGLRLPQVEPMRLYRQIAALISDRIDEGLFPVGSLLPAERDLAERLGVSRTSVREALIALEVGGKVSIRVGHGVQILQATPRSDHVGANADVSEGDIGPIQMMEARRLIEPRSAELAAMNRNAANLKHIERALNEQARAESVKSSEYRDWDRAFHLEIAKASGNAALTLLIGTLWDYRRKPMFEKMEELLLGPDRLFKTPAEHRRIFEAIATADRTAARHAMKMHLDAVLRAFSRGLGTK
jgi:GntR family transcriptional regulator, transcriptional repressor for pyruvate dehydrogenase complex